MKPDLQGYASTAQSSNPEALKYSRLWEFQMYRDMAPGEALAQIFLEHARPRPGATVIDFGCGTGRGAVMLALLGGLNVTMVDFVDNCLDAEVREMLQTQAHALRFVKADLEQPLPIAAEYGYAIDLMEHIPEIRVDRVLDHILQAAQHVFFSISTVEDRCGALIGERLHLTVQSYGWWLNRLSRHDCVVHWSAHAGDHCLFYVTAWQDGQAVVDVGMPNVAEEQIRANVRHNCAQGWQQVQPYETNDLEIMIVGGGPSLSSFEEEITQKRAEGVKLITLNGAYHWCLDHGLTPSAQVVVDARPFNARFTKPVVDGCKYLIASQCDPAVLDGLPKDRTYLWHTTAEIIADLLKEQYELWWGIPGGSTVLLRVIPLMRMLGYRKFHLFGMDSCLSDDGRHHAYAQGENDDAPIIPVTVGGRLFQCHLWHVAQAQEFMALIKFLGEEIDLEIYGDGLLRQILETGAQLAREEETGHGGGNLENLRKG